MNQKLMLKSHSMFNALSEKDKDNCIIQFDLTKYSLNFVHSFKLRTNYNFDIFLKCSSNMLNTIGEVLTFTESNLCDLGISISSFDAYASYKNISINLIPIISDKFFLDLTEVKYFFKQCDQRSCDETNALIPCYVVVDESALGVCWQGTPEGFKYYLKELRKIINAYTFVY